MWKTMNLAGKIGMIGAAIGGLVGIIAVYAAILVPPGNLSGRIGPLIFVTVFILVFLGIFFFAFRKAFGLTAKQQKLQAAGVPAEATILEVHETGITVNEVYPVIKLKLQVRPPGGQPYEVEIKTLIDRFEIPRFQPGAVMAVKYDPENPTSVAIDRAQGADNPQVEEAVSVLSNLRKGSSPGSPVNTAQVDDAMKLLNDLGVPGSPGTPATAFSPLAPGGLAPGVQAGSPQAGQMEKFLQESDNRSQEILATGKPAQSVIVQASSLNVFINGNNPAMSFILDVQPEGETSFQAQVTAVIRETSVAEFQPGKIIYVKYDPSDHSRVAIDHS